MSDYRPAYPTPLPPEPLMTEQTGQELAVRVKETAASALASGIMASSRRQFSVSDALKLYNDCYFALYPDDNDPAFREWQATADLDKYYG